MGKIIIPAGAKTMSKYMADGTKEIQFLEGSKGDVSDGYHSFKDLYRHRYTLFLALMAGHPQLSWISKQHHDGTMFDANSFIAGMTLPTGQVSYHYPLREWDKVASLVNEVDKAPEWDNHTPEDVITRIEEWLKGWRGPMGWK